jgi:hypothetical protein
MHLTTLNKKENTMLRNIIRFALGLLAVGLILWFAKWGCDYMQTHTPPEVLREIQQIATSQTALK